MHKKNEGKETGDLDEIHSKVSAEQPGETAAWLNRLCGTLYTIDIDSQVI